MASQVYNSKVEFVNREHYIHNIVKMMVNSHPASFDNMLNELANGYYNTNPYGRGEIRFILEAVERSLRNIPSERRAALSVGYKLRIINQLRCDGTIHRMNRM